MQGRVRVGQPFDVERRPFDLAQELTGKNDIVLIVFDEQHSDRSLVYHVAPYSE